MDAFYADHFVLPLPEGHRFPMSKYRLLRDGVAGAPGLNLLEAPAATDTQLLLAHDPVYVQKVITGTLEPKEQREIGFPWTPGMLSVRVVPLARQLRLVSRPCEMGLRLILRVAHIMRIGIREVVFVCSTTLRSRRE